MMKFSQFVLDVPDRRQKWYSITFDILLGLLFVVVILLLVPPNPIRSQNLHIGSYTMSDTLPSRLGSVEINIDHPYNSSSQSLTSSDTINIIDQLTITTDTEQNIALQPTPFGAGAIIKNLSGKFTLSLKAHDLGAHIVVTGLDNSKNRVFQKEDDIFIADNAQDIITWEPLRYAVYYLQVVLAALCLLSTLGLGVLRWLNMKYDLAKDE